jgi:hypothetical protein
MEENTMRPKNTLLKLLALTMILSVLLPTLATVNTQANGFPSFSGGSGSEQSPYLILTKEDLEALSQLSAGGEKCSGIYFAQTRSIELSGNWTPIKEFCGIYNGGNNEITGLSCSQTTDYTGFFGKISTGAQLKNIRINNADISGSGFTGILAGCLDNATISSCHVTGAVVGTYKVGGLVGSAASGVITDSSATCSVTGTDSYTYVGGLVGHNSICEISRSYSAGEVKGLRSYCGGLIGYNYRSNITNCYSSCDVGATAVDSTCIGGLAGYNSSIRKIKYCYSTGNVTGHSYVGGITGENCGEITYCYTSCKITGDFDSPIWGVSVSGTCNASYYLSDNSVPGYWGARTYEQMSDKESFIGWDFDTTWGIGLDSAYDFPTLGLGGSIITTQSPGGTISPDKTLVYAPGSVANYSLTPNYGYSIVDVLIDNYSKGSIRRFELTNIQTSHKISAVFRKQFMLVPQSELMLDRDDGVIVSFDDNLTVSDIISDFSSTDVVLMNNGEQLSQDDTAGTGCKVNLMVEDEIHDSLTLVILGDVNGDGKANISDVRKALRVAVDLESFDDVVFEYAANVVDSDQKINIADVRLLLRVAVGLQEFLLPE